MDSTETPAPATATVVVFHDGAGDPIILGIFASPADAYDAAAEIAGDPDEWTWDHGLGGATGHHTSGESIVIEPHTIR